VQQLNPTSLVPALQNNLGFVVALVNGMGSGPLSELIDSLSTGALGQVTVKTHVSLDVPFLDMMWFDARAIVTGALTPP